jgi:hypothetical protein
MSLLTHFPGDIKSGKTLSAVFWTKRLMSRIGCPVFTNMASLKYQGLPWGEQLELDRLLVDITETDLNNAYYKLGILLLDEAHILWATNEMRGARGRAITALIAQAGKRGLIVVFTAHLAGMIDPKVRELTQCIIRCQTPDEGRTVFWDVRDPKAWRAAEYDGRIPPQDQRFVLHNAWRQHNWYDTNEVVDPFGAAKGAGATKASKSFLRELERIKEGTDTARPVSVTVQKEMASHASAVRREVLSETKSDPNTVRSKAKTRRFALGGPR